MQHSQPTQPAPGLASIWENANKTWSDLKANALEKKVWFETQLAWVEQNDDKLHWVALGVFAAILLIGGGPSTIFFMAVGYASEAIFPDKIKDALQHVNDVWLKTKTAKVTCAAVGILLLPAYSYPVISAVFGGYLSHHTTPKPKTASNIGDAQSKEPIEVKEAEPAAPERVQSWKHIKFWPLWTYVFPRWFQQNAAAENK